MKAGKELNMLIANHIFGYTKENPPKGCLCGRGESCATCTWSILGQAENYSTDIAAAWEVLENIVQRVSGTDWEIGKCEPHGILVYCTFEVWFAVRNEYVFYTERGKSAPHAICLAALKAVGVEV